MSSGFVSGGTTEKPMERDDAWLQAQKDIEETRRRKEEESQQEGGKTLYEVLQQNKGEYISPCCPVLDCSTNYFADMSGTSRFP